MCRRELSRIDGSDLRSTSWPLQRSQPRGWSPRHPTSRRRRADLSCRPRDREGHPRLEAPEGSCNSLLGFSETYIALKCRFEARPWEFAVVAIGELPKALNHLTSYVKPQPHAVGFRREVGV